MIQAFRDSRVALLHMRGGASAAATKVGHMVRLQETVAACAVDPRAEVVLHDWPPEVRSEYPTAEGTNEVTFTREDPGRLEMEINTRGDGWLVLSDTWFPSWRAWVTDSDGRRKEVPIVRAWSTFMTIPVGTGSQRVEVSYQPRAVTAGVVLTGLGWIGFLLLPLIGGPSTGGRSAPGSLETVVSSGDAAGATDGSPLAPTSEAPTDQVPEA